MLKEKFKVNVSSTRIMRERSADSKGVGFARIEESKICDKIIQDLNNRPFPGFESSMKLLLVKLADSGNNKKQRNNSSSTTNNNNNSSGSNTNSSSNGVVATSSSTNLVNSIPVPNALNMNISANNANNFNNHNAPTSANTSIHSANNQNNHHFASPAANFANGFPIQIVDNQVLLHQQPHHQIVEPFLHPMLHQIPHQRAFLPTPYNTTHGPNGMPYIIIQQHLPPPHQHQMHLQQQQQQILQNPSTSLATSQSSSQSEQQQNPNNNLTQSQQQSQLYPIQQQFANLSLSQNIPHQMMQQSVFY